MSPNPRPVVSVVLPLYNGAQHVAAAVESVLSQTFRDLEVVVVDDGSSDGGADLVERVADERVRVIRHPLNGGIARALNTGIGATSADLIARMDADDVSWPDRISRQVAFLAEHPEVGIVGCNPMLLEESGAPIRPYPVLTRDRELRRMLPLQGPFCHGSVMFRRTAFDAAGPYRTEDEPAEDFALWLRMAQVTQLANLEDVLYGLRISDTSVSATSARRQVEQRDVVRARAREQLGSPSLHVRQLREEERHYRSLAAPEGPMLAARHAAQHQELACVDLLERGVRALPNVLVAASLGLFGPRTLVRMWRFFREERRSRSLTTATADPR